MSGSAVADVGGIGHLSYQAMVDEGFDKEFSASVTISSSTVGPIIPPSIPMVVYAMVANVSVGKMFFGGILPGLIIAGILMVYVYIISVKRNYPKKKIESARKFLRDLLIAFSRISAATDPGDPPRKHLFRRGDYDGSFGYRGIVLACAWIFPLSYDRPQGVHRQLEKRIHHVRFHTARAPGREGV